MRNRFAVISLMATVTLFGCSEGNHTYSYKPRPGGKLQERQSQVAYEESRDQAKSQALAQVQKQKQLDDDRKEKLAKALVPHMFADWPIRRTLYCREINAVSDVRHSEASSALDKDASFEVRVNKDYVDFIPMDGRAIPPSNGGYSGRGLYQFLGNSSKDQRSTIENGRLVLGPNPDRAAAWKQWSNQFFIQMTSGPLTLAYTIPVPNRPEMVEEGYAFTLTGTNVNGEVSLPLGCRSQRLNDDEQARENVRENLKAQAAADAEARRPRTHYERIIEHIEAQGGNCPFIAEHLRLHMQRAQQTQDWTPFGLSLVKAEEHGCLLGM